MALGFAAKELIRWERDGRLVHIFNPASFPLAVFALALIVTGMSDVTRGQDIAISQFYPPQMYLWIFLIALPGQYLFGVTTMTMAAVVYDVPVRARLLRELTGVYFFYDSGTFRSPCFSGCTCCSRIRRRRQRGRRRRTELGRSGSMRKGGRTRAVPRRGSPGCAPAGRRRGLSTVVLYVRVLGRVRAGAETTDDPSTTSCAAGAVAEPVGDSDRPGGAASTVQST